MHSQIYLLRHGDVIGGACYRGITDDPLSSLGWQQMQHALTEQLEWDIIISSPLLRCRLFAETLIKETSCPFITVQALQEINFGDWEGKTAAQIDTTLLTQYYADPAYYTPPKGEPFLLFQERVLQAWQSILTNHPNKKILLVTHAGVIRVILAHVLGLDLIQSFRIKIAHACLSRIDCFYSKKEADYLQLFSHNNPY